MKTRHRLLAAALAGAAALALFGDRTADDGIAQPTQPAARPRGTPQPRVAPVAQPAEGILALQSREAPAPAAAPGKSAGGALFARQDWTPQPPPGRAAAKLPPSAPPLPFVYLGKKIEDGVCEVYLGRGEQSLIVRERTVIDGTWRVDSIKPPTVTLTYLPLNQAQLLIIGGND